jgi:hypothetical protein
MYLYGRKVDMIEIILFGLLFSVIWLGFGFIGAGYMFAFWTKKHTRTMLTLNEKVGRDWYKDDCKKFFVDILVGAGCLFVVLTTKEYRSYGWMFPWSKKTKEYLGIE